MRGQGNTPADCLFLQEQVDAWLPTAKSLYSSGEPGIRSRSMLGCQQQNLYIPEVSRAWTKRIKIWKRRNPSRLGNLHLADNGKIFV